MRWFALLLTALAMPLAPAQAAKLRVVTTTTDLADIVRHIAGDRVQVESIARGYQNPHAVDAKPSYIIKLTRADAIIRVGLGLDTVFHAREHRRFVNGRDPVCRIPPPIGYRHHGGATVLVDPHHGTSVTLDHAIVYYAEILELLADELSIERSQASAA